MSSATRFPRRRLPALAALAAFGLVGCLDDRGENRDAFRIASPWPCETRAALAREFAEWLRGRPDVSVEARSISWVAAETGPDVLAASRADLLLGGPSSAFQRLAADGRLEPLADDAPRPYWVAARRERAGLTPGPSPRGRLALDDPRVDPATRAWCLGAKDGPWPARYAELATAYGEAAAPAGWRVGSAAAAVERGRAGRTLGPTAETDGEIVELAEGAAIPVGSRRPKAARAFLKFLAETRGAAPGPAFASQAEVRAAAEADGLAADLLGATLVDAQPELRAATAAVREAGSPEWAVGLLTQLPPWPPASVEELLAKEGEAGLALVEALIGQVAPDPSLRPWLSRSWLRPRRAVDPGLLAEVAAAEGGRLAREPRFRSWLRAEWTQWARQRYRWVARRAASGVAPSVPPPPPSDS